MPELVLEPCDSLQKLDDNRCSSRVDAEIPPEPHHRLNAQGDLGVDPARLLLDDFYEAVPDELFDKIEAYSAVFCDLLHRQKLL